MKPFYVFLVAGAFVAGEVQSQTRPAHTSASPAAPVARPAETPPNRQQELYDQYHGITRKSAPAAVPPPARQPAISVPVASVPAVGAKQPASAIDGVYKVRVGIRGGITRLVYAEQQADAASPTAGFVGGFVFNIGQGIFSFQPELNYARYASSATVSRGTVSETIFTFGQDRFEMPLFLKIASGPASNNRLFLNLGPYGAYVVGNSLNGQTVAVNGSGGKFSFGAAAGVGAALKAGPGHLTIELRGLYELSNTRSTPGNLTGTTNAKAVNTQATVGYMFPLGSSRY